MARISKMNGSLFSYLSTTCSAKSKTEWDLILSTNETHFFLPEFLFELFRRSERFSTQRTFYCFFSCRNLMIEPNFHTFNMDVISTTTSDFSREDKYFFGVETSSTRNESKFDWPTESYWKFFQKKFLLTNRTNVTFANWTLFHFSIVIINVILILYSDKDTNMMNDIRTKRHEFDDSLSFVTEMCSIFLLSYQW